MTIALSLELTQKQYEVGESVLGKLEWKGSTREVKEIQVGLRWHTTGRGDLSQEIVVRESVGDRIVTSSNSYDFSVLIPVGSPISYDGKLIRIIWEVFGTYTTRQGSKGQKVFGVSLPFNPQKEYEDNKVIKLIRVSPRRV
jgi:hypothetical protein